MKLKNRLSAMGLVLILILGTLSACGEQGTVSATPPAETPTGSVEPTPTPSPDQTPEPEPKPTPELSEPLYDPLTDPNVYWGTERDMAIVYGFLSKHVFLGWKLEELLQQVDDDALIAIEVSGMDLNTDYGPEIDPEHMEIPEELDLDGALTNMLLEYDRAETREARLGVYARMLEYLWGVQNELYAELERMEAQVKAELEQEIWQELGTNPETATKDEAWSVRQRASIRFSGNDWENEEYWQVHETYESLNSCRGEFLEQFTVLYIEEMRQLLADRGIIPIYGSLTENPCPSYIVPDRFFGTFVATAAQIKSMREQVAYYEGYHFVLAIKP